MDTLRTKNIAVIAGVLVVAGILSGPRVQGQQAQGKFTGAYSKAAFFAILAMEPETISEPADVVKRIEVTEAQAASPDEIAATNMIRKIYRLKLQDDNLIRAYVKLSEIENARDPSDEAETKRRKDDTVAQLADSGDAIKRREDACFEQLEVSLRQRSLQNIPACSEWIRKFDKTSGN